MLSFQIEAYALEIISRALSIKGKCEFLLSQDYPSNAAVNLAKTIKNISNYLATIVITKLKLIVWTSLDEEDCEFLLKELQDIDAIIKDLGGQVQYVDLAKTENLPWSIIRAFENFISDVLHQEKPEILLLPEWDYNYTVQMVDIRLVYETVISGYETIEPTISVKRDVLKNLQSPFYIFTFPFLERKNIGLHSLLGHELGHLLADKYINSVINDFPQLIQNELENIVTQELAKNTQFKPGEALFENLKIYELTDKYSLVTKYWSRALEELLSDAIGAYIFGPAVLFASLEVAVQEGLDQPPNPELNFYPPWRTRLKEIHKVISKKHDGDSFFPLKKETFKKVNIDKINDIWKYVEREVQKDNNDVYFKDEYIKLAYKQINNSLEKGFFYVLNEFKLERFEVTPANMYNILPELIERIDEGIPPNASESPSKERLPATVAQIINASWINKISWDKPLIKDERFNVELYKQRNRLNNLILKAIEYVNLEA